MPLTICRGCDTAKLSAVSASVSRRSALRVGGGGALALVIGVAAGRLVRRDPSPGPVGEAPQATTATEPVVLPGIGEIASGVVALGRRVVAATGWDEPDQLLTALPDADGDPLERAAAIVQTEFDAGDTVVVDGWVLATSEARAAAVISLMCDATSC